MNKNRKHGKSAIWQDKIVDLHHLARRPRSFRRWSSMVVGFIVARWIGKLLDRWLTSKAMEPPMRKLLVRILRLLILPCPGRRAGTAGMDVTAFIAGVGVAGVGIGLAMQGIPAISWRG